MPKAADSTMGRIIGLEKEAVIHPVGDNLHDGLALFHASFLFGIGIDTLISSIRFDDGNGRRAKALSKQQACRKHTT